MGRTRGFDESAVLDRAAEVFAGGYERTSIDDVVTATGLHRGSLYATFGSKRGLFRAAVGRALDRHSALAADLVVIAMLELAPRDPEIRSDCRRGYAALFASEPAHLGRHLLDRAGLTSRKDQS
ncbi:MAG: TetR/AcrR family transcriptional regulator [Nocardioidaceae bacterium]|nr:TetR/AcrR family transcriptional regulator [Nocardioidaceae bacterium]